MGMFAPLYSIPASPVPGNPAQVHQEHKQLDLQVKKPALEGVLRYGDLHHDVLFSLRSV